MLCKKDYIWNPTICDYEKYLASITDESVITFDEIMDILAKLYAEETKTILKETIQTKRTSASFYILLSFLIIVIILLIAVSIDLIKCQLKQYHLLPYHHITNTKLKEVLY